jgi:hypothetical protein
MIPSEKACTLNFESLILSNVQIYLDTFLRLYSFIRMQIVLQIHVRVRVRIHVADASYISTYRRYNL